VLLTKCHHNHALKAIKLLCGLMTAFSLWDSYQNISGVNAGKRLVNLAVLLDRSL